MKVVVVTGTEPHHLRLCEEIARRFRVVGILHPERAEKGLEKRWTGFLKRKRTYGWTLYGLHLLGKLPRGTCDRGSEMRGKDVRAERVDAATSGIVRNRCDVTDRSTWELLRSLNPDVTICLGGPVYPAGFIEASPLMLNFHSGISPIYNGAASIQFAFSNGHPQFCGGTLMIMGTKVDGGEILGHFLPEITSGDGPSSLFSKTVEGGVKMYIRILESLESTPVIRRIAQKRPLFFTRGADFSLHHVAMIEKHMRNNISASCSRPETMVEYWRAPSMEDAQSLYDRTMETLLWEKVQSEEGLLVGR